MKQETAKKLLPWVQKSNEKFFLFYVEERLDFLRKVLEVCSDQNEIFRLQGQIKEVKRLLTIRDEITEKSKPLGD